MVIQALSLDSTVIPLLALKRKILIEIFKDLAFRNPTPKSTKHPRAFQIKENLLLISKSEVSSSSQLSQLSSSVPNKVKKTKQKLEKELHLFRRSLKTLIQSITSLKTLTVSVKKVILHLKIQLIYSIN